MNFLAIIEALKIINPSGRNDAGNCTTCAADTSKALTTGQVPTEASLGIVTSIPGALPYYQEVKSFPLGSNGAENVLEWLKKEAPDGVYVFEVEDHAYNAVKAEHIYIIDSNLQQFLQLTKASDAIVVIAGMGSYNYLDPPPEDEDFDELMIYYTGPLHHKWYGI